MARARPIWPTWIGTLLVAALGASSSLAWADPAPTGLGTVRVEAPREAKVAGPDPDAPSFVTLVDARNPSASVASVADLLEREAGIRVRSLGGLGAFTSVSIRGSDAAEVAVFLDGVPLNRASSSVVDLSQLPVDGLERVEVYRGIPPPELAGQAIGGAINLVSRTGERGAGWRIAAGAGSLGTRTGSIARSTGGKRFHADASVAYRGSDGDFTYYDYHGTVLDTSDDRVTLRRNNGFNQVAADVTLGGEGAAPWRLGVHGFVKDQGVPGLGTGGAETRTAHFTLGRLVVDGSVERRRWPNADADVRLGGHLLMERTAFDNHDGDQVGNAIASRTDGETWAGGVDARLRVAGSAHDLFTAWLSLEGERFRPYDLLHPDRAPAPSARLRGSLTLSDDVRLFGDRLVLVPSLRFEGVASDLAPGLSVIAKQQKGAETADAWVSPQLGVRFRVARWLALKGSVGRQVRLPTTIELFGDGAFILPRPALRPETAVGGDVGATVDLARGPLGFEIEAALFGRQVWDFIALVPSARAAAAQNVGDHRFLGVEGRVRVRAWKALAVTADYTWVRGINDGDDSLGAAGKALPGVPAHKLGVRADLHHGPFGLFYEMVYIGDVWRDPQNLPDTIIPARSLHALGGSLGPFDGLPVTLTVEARNLADLRVVDLPLGGAINMGRTVPYPLVDFMDYPLPGRTIFVTLALRK